MTQHRPLKPSDIDPKTSPESNLVVLMMFNQVWAPQTSKNIKKPKENLCVSRVCLFRIDQDFVQKTFKNDPPNRSKFDQTSIKKMI